MTAQQLIEELQKVAPNTVVLLDNPEFGLDDSVACQLQDVEVSVCPPYTFYYTPEETKATNSLRTLTKAIVIF